MSISDRDLLQAGYRYALSLRPGRQDAEDLVQEAWLRLRRRGTGIDSKALLFTTIRNLCIDQYRRDKLIVLEAFDEREGGAARIDSAGERDDAAIDLAGPLARLRREEREALFLNVVEGYTAAEIADFTDRSRGTVLSLVHRAKEKLRQALGSSVAPGGVVPVRYGDENC